MRTEKIKFALLLALCCPVTIAALFPAISAEEQQNPVPKQPINYEKFTHASHSGTVSVPGTNHARVLKCDSCHNRRDRIESIVQTTDRNRRLGLKFPGHKACIECHVDQFTGTPQKTCTICHETRQGLTARPPQRDYPTRYDFNAFFDAKQHELHIGYKLPASGKMTDCNFCHKQDARPAVLTIASHTECFACHSPSSGDAKGSEKSGCTVCHTQPATDVQPYSAKYVSRAYGALFTHKSHVAYMNGKCDMCHTISGGYNQPVPASLRVRQHLTPAERGGRGCFSCHDGGVHYGRKVFSGEPGSEGGGSCQKCHTREDFKVFPK